MLIAISGSQGVGKTTLLQHLSKGNYTVDTFKVSRAVQKEMGYSSLCSAVDTFEKMKKFQENIILRKFEHDSRLIENIGDKIVFTERSFIDVLAYAELWCTHFPKMKSSTSNWLCGFKEACFNFQNIYSGLVLIEPNDSIRFEDDPERGAVETQRQIDRRLKELSGYLNIPVQFIDVHDINERVQVVVNFVNGLSS